MHAPRALLLFSLPFLACTALPAQLTLQDSHTSASLRGVDSLGGGIVWASGSEGTVLRTTDDGVTWQKCAVPPGGEKLDFRGVQAFDADTAVVMASGKGSLSRIYRTTDGCKTWKLSFEDPDETGFFDTLRKVTSKQMYLLGDPVMGKFSMFYTSDQGVTWSIADDPGLDADKDDGAFAASNSSLVALGNQLFFGTGGGPAAHVYFTYPKCPEGATAKATEQACPLAWRRTDTPLAAGSGGAGVFSLAGRNTSSQSGVMSTLLVAVGGDYTKPGASAGTAAWSRDGGATWNAAAAPPAGYRSAVVFDQRTLRFVAAGPNGVEISTDNGAHWAPVAGLEPETAKGWNAISLPFMVGWKGRIGRFTPTTISLPVSKH